MIDHTIGNDLYHLVTVIWGMVYDPFTRMKLCIYIYIPILSQYVLSHAITPTFPQYMYELCTYNEWFRYVRHNYT